jgi:hypothetical protein
MLCTGGGRVLCREHDAAMVVPLGWALADRRTPSRRPTRAKSGEWLPVFDHGEDLHGLLKARGRLLSGAFNSGAADTSRWTHAQR